MVITILGFTNPVSLIRGCKITLNSAQLKPITMRKTALLIFVILTIPLISCVYSSNEAEELRKAMVKISSQPFYGQIATNSYKNDDYKIRCHYIVDSQWNSVDWDIKKQKVIKLIQRKSDGTFDKISSEDIPEFVKTKIDFHVKYKLKQ